MNIRNLSEYISDDNARMRELFKVYRSMKPKDREKTRDLLHSYMAGVRRHIDWEEKFLFPLFESRLGLENQGPAERLREEHREIETVLENIHDLVIKIGTDATDEEMRLMTLMDKHNEGAGSGFYSILDNSLDPQEKLKAYKSMKDVPHQNGNPCCEKH